MKTCLTPVIQRHLSLNSMVLRMAGCVLFSMAIGGIAHAASSITPTTGTGSLGTQVLPPSNNVYGITGGKPVGTNLFHSFADFNVATGDTAQFQTSNLIPNTGTSNILGRVTGGSPSAIFGTVDSATYYPNANLFLMNPYGFLFGPNAMVNVGGMVAFTTADYLKLTDGNMFKALPDVNADATLTAFPVATFGFLGSNPAAIVVQGSQLTVANGTGLSLIGGNRGFNYIDPDTGLSGSVPDGMTMTGGKLSAPSGQVNLVSVAGPGEIAASDFMPSSGMAMGNLTLSQGAVLDASGDGGGTVRIRAGQFVMDQSAIVAHTTGVNDGAPTAIDVNVTDSVLLDNQSALLAWATDAGRSGDIAITARTVDVAGGSFLYMLSTGSGPTGNITVAGSESILVRGDQFGNPSGILSDSLGTASTGSITLRAPLITISDMGSIETRMFGSSEGARAGDITIEATNLNLLNGGTIHTISSSDISPSGNINITVGEAINLVGTNDITMTSNITNENINGGTGTISIHTGSLALSDQARINSQTWFDSDPAALSSPKIAITADSFITLSSGSRIDVGGFFSDTGRLEMSAQNLTMSGTSSITTLSSGSGAAGPILINVHDLTVSEGSQIVSSSGQGFGRGGDITISASGAVTVTGQGTDPFMGTLSSGIFSNTMAGFEDPSFTGNAGNISITAHSIEVSNGARIDSSSQFFALGNAGNIDLTAPTITVNGGTVSTSTEFTGQAGAITLNADTVALRNGGQLTSNSAGFADAGSITITANNGLSMQGSSITTLVTPNEGSTAGGGDITVTTSPAATVYLENSMISASVADGPGGGGNISIDPQFVILQNSQILAQAAQGQGGAITITTNLFLPDATSIVNADSGSGVNGSVTIQSPNAPASGKIQPLGKSPLEATSLLNQRCAALAGGEFSSFTVAGRDSLPTEPGSWLSSPLATLSAGMRLGASGEGGRLLAGDEGDKALLSLRQIAPSGFLTQTFAVDRSAGCSS